MPWENHPAHVAAKFAASTAAAAESYRAATAEMAKREVRRSCTTSKKTSRKGQAGLLVQVEAIRTTVSSLKEGMRSLRMEAQATSAANAKWVDEMGAELARLVRKDATFVDRLSRRSPPRVLRSIDTTPLVRLLRSAAHPQPPTKFVRLPKEQVGGRTAERELDVSRLIALKVQEKETATEGATPQRAAPPSQTNTPDEPPTRHVASAPATGTQHPFGHRNWVGADTVRWREVREGGLVGMTSSSATFDDQPSSSTRRLEHRLEKSHAPTMPHPPPPQHSHYWSLRPTKQIQAAMVAQSQSPLPPHHSILPRPHSPPEPPLFQTSRHVGGASGPVRREVTSGSVVALRTPRAPTGRFKPLSVANGPLADQAGTGSHVHLVGPLLNLL